MGWLDDLGQEYSDTLNTDGGKAAQVLVPGLAGTQSINTIAKGKNPLKNTPLDQSNKDLPWGPGDNLGGQANDQMTKALEAANGLNPPNLDKIGAANAGPNAYDGIQTSGAGKQAQQASMAALADLAAHGGRNAASDANLASIEAHQNSNAKGARDAAVQSMEARGMGGSGASLLAALTANQNAATNANQMDLGELGNEQNNALSARMGAAQVGSGLDNQEFNQAASRASAQNAINQFNAGAQQDASKFNSGLGQQQYEDQYQKAGLQSGIYGQNAGFLNQQNNAHIAANGNLAGSLIGGATGIGAAAMSKKQGSPDANAYASGGQVPGDAEVAGNSYANDKIPAMLSPHEVVVPRSLAMGGSPDAIVNFVKHPPAAQPIAPVGSPADKNKEAMLAALKHMGRK